MGVASLTLGIISLFMSFIPLVGIAFLVTAITGIILGSISLHKKLETSKSIIGIVTSSIAIIIIILYIIGFTFIFTGKNGIIERIKELTEEKDVTEMINTIPSYTIGEKFENNNISITFISAEKDFKGYNANAKIADGYKIIRAEFEFENVGISNQYISSYDFNCYADGYSCNPFWSIEDSSFSTTLSSGNKIKGILYYEVPENSDIITIEYNSNTLEDETIEFVIK